MAGSEHQEDEDESDASFEGAQRRLSEGPKEMEAPAAIAKLMP